MSKLSVKYCNVDCVEGDIVAVNNLPLRIDHITMTGFLYMKQCNTSESYVGVVTGRTERSYYSDWDYLNFIECAVQIIDD